MPSPTIPATAPVHPSASTWMARLAVVAALLFSLARAAIVLSGGLRSSGWDLALVMTPVLLALLLLAGVGLSLLGPWRRPVRLVVVGPGRLRAPATPSVGWLVAAQVMVFTAAITQFGVVSVDLLRDPDAPEPFGYLLAVVTWLMAALWLLLLVAFVVAFFDGRPRMDLTPSGIEYRDLLGRRHIAWEALAPGTPVREPSGNSLVLTVVRPELVERRGLAWGLAARPWLTLSYLSIHPWFLTDVLRWYVDHPQERTAIGTAAGNERLCRALGVGC
ncbi:PH domain-containing protein [Micromonospora sp. NPDC048999]|uniref:PH domain-containing protein n=1 Tax=Micromonospora sp. NPDC048999 TaxID=3155391 RepID=UPI0033FBAF33